MAYTSKEKQVFVELSGELGEQVQNIEVLSENEIDDSVLLPGTYTNTQSNVTRFVRCTFGALRNRLNAFVNRASQEWEGDDGQGGLKAEMNTALGAVNGAVEDAELVKTEWQGADGQGGLKAEITAAHEQAAADHITAGEDHTTAAADHTTASADHSTAAADHITADADHVASASATASANAAASSASGAADSANQAAADASEKALAANQATVDANQATANADAATAAATEATTLANNAAGSATSAAGAATTAAGDASAAASRAATAATDAEKVNASLNGTTITVTDRNGQSNSTDLKGEKGDRGKGFEVKKTFATKAALESYNYTAPTFEQNDFVMVQSNVDDPDNARLYMLNVSLQPVFICDMSGTIGLTGKTPQMAAGTVTTGLPNTQAVVTVTSDGYDSDGNPKYKVNFTIPKGDKPVISAQQDGTLLVDNALLTTIIKDAVATFQQNEGTSASSAGDGSRWGAYKTAENARGTAYSNAEDSRDSQYQTAEDTRGNSYSSAESSRDNQYQTAEDSRNNLYAAAEGTSTSVNDNSRWASHNAAQAARQETWNSWFSDTLSTGVRKLWSDFWTTVNANWTAFYGATASDGVRGAWTDWFSKTGTGVQSVWTAWFGSDDNSGVRKQVKDAVAAADAATTGAEKVNASLSGTTLTVTNRNGQQQSANLKGDTGDAAGFGTPEASIPAGDTVGTPTVTVTATGPNTAKVFSFAFSHLKGDKGDNLDWDSMSEAEKEALAQRVLSNLTFASKQTCEDIIEELT